ncbi:ABC transporter permease [Vagococcus elongatus]|uniref:ABC3 transporter permease protein domain-containing protein n=1 Tax=Vagococcus elongatus TaxID=180344 RepID=A0A430AM42_9ENTE|nr:ABC transporter permease [Vagococcus elongatus]RSU09013.1 hypothetical protein CBF29_12440 [Vagococcus elongatus]
MNFWKRALASVSRRKGKSLILFAVVFILGNVIAGAIAIQQSTNNVEKNIKKNLGASATISIDYEAMMNLTEDESESAFKESALTNLAMTKQVGELPYVAYFDYTVPSYFQTEKLKAIEPEEEEEGTVSYGGGMGFTVVGGNTEEIADQKKGKIKLVEGRSFSEQELSSGKQVGIISKTLAEQEKIAIGDKIIFDRVSRTGEEFTDDGSIKETENTKTFVKDIPVEIIGLFDVQQTENKGKDKEKDNQHYFVDYNYQLAEQKNTVYMPNEAVMKIEKEYHRSLEEEYPNFWDFPEEEYQKMKDEEAEETTYYQPFFMLKNPEDAEAFRKEAQALIGKHDKVLISSDQFESVSGPLSGMSKISGLVLYVAVGASLLIVTLVILLFLRDRKHELGVYLSLGEKRVKVIGQIVVEVMIISLVAITLSVFTGNLVADGVSSSLIASQEQTENYEMYSDPDFYEFQQLGTETVSQEDVISAYEVKLSASYIVTFYLVGTATILLSTIVPLIYIMRLNPKKIMM